MGPILRQVYSVEVLKEYVLVSSKCGSPKPDKDRNNYSVILMDKLELVNYVR